MRLRPDTLFGKAAVTLAVAFVYFGLFTWTAVVFYVQVPVARQAADDLATLIVLAANTWSATAPERREQFAADLFQSHQLRLGADGEAPQERVAYRPYLTFVEEALQRRTGRATPLATSLEGGTRWYWARLSSDDVPVRIGFAADRVGASVPSALIWMVLGSAILVLLTAMTLTGRITRPLRLLSKAAERMARGQDPDPLPETGPRELARLSCQFNHMASQVRELLANRTTMLAGISHDLRTPIARMRLSIEMLPEDVDPPLLDGMRRDLDEMNRLITDALALGREQEATHRERVDLGRLVEELVADVRRGGRDVEWSGHAPCFWEINPHALRRVVANLVENALRYGAGRPVAVVLECDGERARIRVLDRGPGIPADEREAVFRPFYRLEYSRSADTGGSGLGLAIARQLAESNGWVLCLRDREGGGTDARVVIAGPDTDAPQPFAGSGMFRAAREPKAGARGAPALEGLIRRRSRARRG